MVPIKVDNFIFAHEVLGLPAILLRDVIILNGFPNQRASDDFSSLALYGLDKMIDF